jgi:hypothetical protein
VRRPPLSGLHSQIIPGGGHHKLASAESANSFIISNTDIYAEQTVCPAFLRAPTRARAYAHLGCRCSSPLFSNACSQTLGCHFLVPATLGESWQRAKVFARCTLKIYGSSQCSPKGHRHAPVIPLQTKSSAGVRSDASRYR